MLTTANRPRYLPPEQGRDVIYGEVNSWTDGDNVLIADRDAPAYITAHAKFVGTMTDLVEYIEHFPYDVGTIRVACDMPLAVIQKGRRLRPTLTIVASKACVMSMLRGGDSDVP